MSTLISTRLYFAYGIQLHLPSMRSILKDPHIWGLACLKSHAISFHGHSAVWDGAIETVVPDKDSEVWGILYQLTFSEWDRLDTFQDVRLDGTGEYFHYPVEVFTEKNDCLEATLYKKAELRESKKPSSEYLELIIQGAISHKLPQNYIEKLRQIETVPASYPVPRLRKKEIPLISDCSSCS